MIGRSMILTDYYKLKRLPEYANNKTPRFDTVASTGEYPMFEELASKSRVKRFFCYYNGIPDTFTHHAQQKAERAITNTKNISSVFIPSLNKPYYGHGDVKGTNDAILFVFSNDYKEMELFIARGLRNNQKQLYSLLYDSELIEQMDILRGRAINQVDK